MTFVEEYIRFDYFTGEQVVRFVVSDNYNDLFLSSFPEGDGIEVDIYLLSSLKMDLDADDGSYAIDAIDFSIDQAACKTDNQVKAMFFVLDAASDEVNRYCAVFFGAPSVENMRFIGRVKSKNSGDDQLWTSVLYDHAINPKRNYKFSALSFDIKILEECKTTGDISSNISQEAIDNIERRLMRVDVFNTLHGIALHRLAYKEPVIQPAPNPNIYKYIFFRPLLNSYTVLQTILNLSSEILFDKYGYTLAFTLLETDLGFKTFPVTYKLQDNEYPIDNSEAWDQVNMRVVRAQSPAVSSGLITPRLTEDAPTSDTSPVYIHRRMLDTRFGLSTNVVNGYIEYDKNDPAIRSAELEQNLSMMGVNNAATILFEVARALGLYVFLKYTTGTNINVEFKSRQSMVESEYTYIVGANEAGYDTSSIASKDNNSFYYALANNSARDGYDYVLQKRINDSMVESNGFKKLKDEIEDNKDRKKMETKRLLLSMSPTLLHYQFEPKYQKVSYPAKLYKVPLNIVTKGNAVESNDASLYGPAIRFYAAQGDVEENNAPEQSAKERIHTAIYITTDPPEEEQQTLLGAGVKVFRPAITILTKINGKDRAFTTLSDYIKEISGADRVFYETEYELTIPSWNGFAKKNESGQIISKSWQNIKLGSKMKLSEVVKRYVNSAWIESTITTDFVVVGIEVNLDTPETKLKLHNVSRFAYGTWEGMGEIPGEINTGGFENFSSLNPSSNNEVRNYTVDSGTIFAGDAVVQLANGNIVKSENWKAQGKLIGIALKEGGQGLLIPVQVSGEVTIPDYNFVNIGSLAFVRRNASSGINISQSMLTAPTASENQIAVLGVVSGTKSIVLNIRTFTWPGA